MNRDALPSETLPPCEFRTRLLSRSRAVCTWDGVSAGGAPPRVVPWDQCRVCSHVVQEPPDLFAASANVPALPPDGRTDGPPLDPFVSAYLETLPCPHRGAQVETRAGELCGTRHRQFPVYSCALYGKCSLTRICVKDRLRNCFECQAAREHLGDR